MRRRGDRPYLGAASKVKSTITAPFIDLYRDIENRYHEAAVHGYADALTPFVLRDLGQWRGWYLIKTMGVMGRQAAQLESLSRDERLIGDAVEPNCKHTPVSGVAG